MCGITGILAQPGGAPPTRDELAAMVGTIEHRGPDEDGYLVDGPIGLGHARLSIIDLSGGRQPIGNEDGSVQVIFNGEIFNYIELRDELTARGHTFRTQSDTEVLVHGYEEWGLDFLQRLNGQWAIALWDSRARRLVLARDRVGILPLYYTRAAGRLVFASEVKALFALPGVERRIDPLGLGQVLTYWSALPPQTIFAGVSQLPPGHLLVAEGDRVETRRWWDWSFPREDAPRPTTSLRDRAATLRELLVDAVRLRLRADVPVGAYLSGGLDSSIIALLIDRYTDTPLRTFSLVFDDAEFDESRYQRMLAARLRSEHSEIRVSRADIGNAFPRTVWHGETAILRTAPTPLLLLSGLVRQHGFKVVLTGEGADEAFGGYDLFREATVRRFWARQPGSKQRPRLLERLYPYLPQSPVRSQAYAEEFFRQGREHLAAPFFGHVPRWTTTQRTWRFLSPDVRAQLAGFDAHGAIAATLPPEIGSWDPLCRDQYIEAHTLLSGYLLAAQGDRVSMASSIEARFPYLDHRVLEYANGLPPTDKLLGLREKLILKLAAADLLPEEIFKRPKQPYRAPDSASFFPDGQPLDWVADLFSAPRIADAGLFEPRAAAALFDKARAGKVIGFADNMAFVGILSTMLVHQQFIRKVRFP
ncbi:MAG TPA: asparagine synthase (glutamine-hydrolyzing) [Kofleriaceae bacterium]|nr:asparagine synthase (glutamine-hydrolyzing) [Kofleriaceae bacterium]